MKSQKEYKILYDHQRVILNLYQVFEHCTEDDIEQGKGWYSQANLFCQELSSAYNVDVLKVAGIIAALSPLKEWSLNMQMAETFLSSGGLISNHTLLQSEKAYDIYKHCTDRAQVNKVLNGKKTINFFNNILYPDDKNYVTVDRHHLAIVSQSNLESCTPNQYNSVKNSTILFADNVNLLPNQVQASLWLCWKRIKKDGKWETRNK